MEIIKKTEGLTEMDQYQMIMDPAVKPIKSVADQTLTYQAFILYTDVNSDGKEVQLLALKTEEGNFTTNSKTFIEDFSKALDILPESCIGHIKVISDKSKSDRTYYRCSITA